MSVTGSIIAGVGAAGALGGAAISANAAGNAASTQANAAKTGAQLQYDLGNENLDLQQQIFNTEQANEKPAIEAGQNAITSINDLMGQKPLSSAPAASEAPINVPQIPAPGAGSTPVFPNGFIPPPGYNGQTGPTQPFEFMPTGRAKGGLVQPLYMQARHYIVGEKGPEMLTMFPDGKGWVTPHKDMPNYLRAMGTHRLSGGPINLPQMPQFPQNYGDPGNGQPPVHQNGPGPGSPGQRPGDPGGAGTAPQNPWQNDPNAASDRNNPLVSGGSSTPSQNNPFTSWTQQFQAPTAAQAAQYPGYQFALQQGENAILDNASAMGTTGSSATGTALDQYANNLATTDYQQVYNNALQQYQQNYNIFSNNQANQWNRLAATAGIGGVAAGQLDSAGNNLGNNAGSTLLGTGQGISQELNNAGAAEASGYVGQANAYGGGLTSLTNSATLPLYLQMLQQNGAGDLSQYENYS
jgi:hypothetical protein